MSVARRAADLVSAIQEKLTMRSAAVVTAMLVAGCGVGDGGQAWAGNVVDSAGIPIVQNPAQGIWAGGEEWAVEEIFRVGGMDAGEDSQFAAVNGVDVDDEGRVYVADQQARRIQVFNSDGSFARSIGQAGDGPGEFGPGLSGVFVHGGVIRVPDLTNQRVNLYDSEGEYTGSLPVLLTEGVPLRWDEAEDGHLVIQRRGVDVEGMAALAEGDPIATLPGQGEEARILATLPRGQSFAVEGGAPSIRLFEAEPIWDLSGSGRLARGMNSDYRIEIWSPDRLERVVVREARPVEVTETEERRILDMTRDLMVDAGAPPQAVEPLLQQMQFADHYPLFAQLVLAGDGALWVQRIRTSRDVPEGVDWSPQDLGSNEWDVFDPEGRYLGMLALPLRFQLLREIDGVLWGLQRDEYDVQSVVGLRLTL
ncbi:MAG: 6-bladed beta-propeller [Gemmatimonadales bacterium]|nr:MAG: 6-bladed beta-propeller [Gemmatimonadales bacterium]